MRILALLSSLAVALLLAGCMSPGKDASTSTSPSCPRWIPGLSKFVGHQVFDTNFTTQPTESEVFPAAPSALEDEDRPLDRINMDFFGPGNGITVKDARLHMRFFRADDGTPLKGYDLSKGVPGASNKGQDAYIYGNGRHEGFTIQVPLVSPGLPPKPTALRMEWTFEGNLDGNPATPSRVEIDTVGQFEYRAC